MNRITALVNRFLGWKLPDTFSPDCYIAFDRVRAKMNSGWPIGTNLLTASEARDMLEHVLAGDPVHAALAELVACKELKDRAEALAFAGPTSEHGENWKAVYEPMRAEYIRRQPLAWEAARAALALASEAPMAADLKPHEQRVVAELDELRERLAKLDTFMGSRTFVNLEPEDRELLVLQNHLMTSLSFVLARRIKRFRTNGWHGTFNTEEKKHE